jgi:hypothetical protein
MPTQPTAARPDSSDPVQTWVPTAGAVVLSAGIVNLTYTGVLIFALARPHSRLSTWADAWVQIAGKALKPAYLLAGNPDCGGAQASDFVVRAWVFDVHLVAINLLVAAAFFVASRPFWPSWAQRLYGAPRWRDGAQDARRADAEVRFGTVIWGAIAAVWWMVLKNDLFESAADCASLRPWFLIREPLLAISGQGFASFAAALWVARDS